MSSSTATVTAPLPAAPPPATGVDTDRARRHSAGTAPARRLPQPAPRVQEGGRTVITEPGRIIIRDPGGQEFVRHDEMERFRYGARDIRTERVGQREPHHCDPSRRHAGDYCVGTDGGLLRRIRRDREGREVVIIDNSYRDPRAVGGFYVDLPPPVIRIPYDRYIVDSEDAPPDLIYDTMVAPSGGPDRAALLARRDPLQPVGAPVDAEHRHQHDQLRDRLVGDPARPGGAAAVDRGRLNRAIQRNPREVFLIEGHTDAVGNDTDNLSLSDRRAESAAELLTQQFQVPAENLTSQGYGSQYLKEQTSGPSRINRRVTIRRITPLLNGGTASLPPPPPGTAPPR